MSVDEPKFEDRPLLPPHLPDCRARYWEGYAVGVLGCADGCPVGEENHVRALATAREKGWLTDAGWTWEKNMTGTERGE